MAAQAKATQAGVLRIEESGIVRSTVFPNALRDVRRAKGFETLIDFHDNVAKKITYSRLAKIERGQAFPRADELMTIAQALGVPPSRLLIDVNDPKFDREAWAKDHVEASLSYRGGDIEDMRLGAALRIRRKELGRSTTEMKAFNLPAATVSRIENADRPFKRWDETTRAGVRRAFGVQTMDEVKRIIRSYEKDGRLADMMHALFSPEVLAERQNKSLSSLLSDIPGTKSKRLRQGLEDMIARVSNDSDEPEMELTSTAAMVPVFEGVSTEGLMHLRPTKEKIRRTNKGVDGFAVKIDHPVLGPGLPAGSKIVFEEIERSDIAEGMVVAILQRDTVRITAAHKIGRGFQLLQSNPEWSTRLSSVEGRFAKMVASHLA